MQDYHQPLPSKRKQQQQPPTPMTISFRQHQIPISNTLARLILYLIAIVSSIIIVQSHGAGRMVRLCIASVDPVKLSSQCVMCNRRDFPLTVIDCTGITKVNDLIANPLSVREATCLIYNCRRQVPDVKPEPYHGAVSNAVNYRGAPNYPITASGSQIYEMMPPSGLMGAGYTMASPQSLAGPVPPGSPYMARFGAGYRAVSGPMQTASGSVLASLPSTAHLRGLIGGPSLVPDRQQALPYALVPAPSTFPFGIQTIQSVSN